MIQRPTELPMAEQLPNGRWLVREPEEPTEYAAYVAAINALFPPNFQVAYVWVVVGPNSPIPANVRGTFRGMGARNWVAEWMDGVCWTAERQRISTAEVNGHGVLPCVEYRVEVNP